MTTGEKIQTLRANQHMTQDTLAKLLKVNRNCLSRIETGKSEATASILKNISNIFDISVDSILEIKGTTTTAKDKIKYITDNCKTLDNKDLDFLVRTISVLNKECVKRKYNMKVKEDKK